MQDVLSSYLCVHVCRYVCAHVCTQHVFLQVTDNDGAMAITPRPPSVEGFVVHNALVEAPRLARGA